MLVGDDAHRRPFGLSLLGETQHREQKILALGPTHPCGPDNTSVTSEPSEQFAFTREFRSSVLVDRSGCVPLVVCAPTDWPTSIKDIIGRYPDNSGAHEISRFGDVSTAPRVNPHSPLRVEFASIDVGPGSAVHDDRRTPSPDKLQHSFAIRDIAVGTGESIHFVASGFANTRQRQPKLARTTGDQDSHS